MKPTISQTTALCLGAAKGSAYAGLAATALLVIAHFFNTAISWLYAVFYAVFTVFYTLAAWVLYSKLVDEIKYTVKISPK